MDGATSIKAVKTVWLVLGACLVAGAVFYLAGVRFKKVEAPQIMPAPRSVSILIGGDMMLGRGVAEAVAKDGDNSIFSKIKEVVGSADYAVANLEGPITTINQAPNNDMRFHFAPALSTVLAATGFDAVSLANNHGLDQGTKGVAETKNNLEVAGLKYFGATDSDLGQVERVVINGRRFSFIGFNDIYRRVDLDVAGKIIAREKQTADMVIVYPHWGEEYKHEHNGRQTALAHAFIDAGADLVVGSHPHVVQGIEEYKRKLIFYSLGNLVFDQYFSADTQRGLMIRINLAANNDLAVDLLPYELPHSQPVLVEGERKEKLLFDLASWSAAGLRGQINSGSIKF